jgi:hypothetical protein
MSAALRGRGASGVDPGVRGERSGVARLILDLVGEVVALVASTVVDALRGRPPSALRAVVAVASDRRRRRARRRGRRDGSEARS